MLSHFNIHATLLSSHSHPHLSKWRYVNSGIKAKKEKMQIEAQTHRTDARVCVRASCVACPAASCNLNELCERKHRAGSEDTPC